MVSPITMSKIIFALAATTLSTVNAAASTGYTREWTSPNAAADGTGYISSYADQNGASIQDFTVQCAASCGSVSNCVFFNVYQELSDQPPANICVLWDQNKPATSATNTFNGGKPISNSAGYQQAATTPTPSGYDLEWSSPNAAADGPGYLSSFVSSLVFYNDLVQECASACDASTSCAFYNVYQEVQSTPASNICVLWNQNKPLSSATNTFNGGRPVSNSNGYVKATTTTTSSVSTTMSTSTTTSASSTESAASPTDVPAAGYTIEWTSENAAADGPGYISSFVSGTTSYSALVAECAGACDATSNCAFFNVYQELSDQPPANICVLWNQDKPASSATNVFNNGKPISNSTGYLKNTAITTTTTTSDSTTTTSESTTTTTSDATTTTSESTTTTTSDATTTTSDATTTTSDATTTTSDSTTTTTSDATTTTSDSTSTTTVEETTTTSDATTTTSDATTTTSDSTTTTTSDATTTTSDATSTTTSDATTTTSDATTTTSDSTTTTTTADATTTTESTTTTDASSTTTSASATSSTDFVAPTEVPGYTQQWATEDAAADGTGFIRSFVLPATVSYDELVAQCASACTADTSCEFINTYQDMDNSGDPSSNVCVLWNQVKPESSATNVFNRGRPIMNSVGYMRDVTVQITTTSSTSTTESTSTTTTAAETTTSSESTPTSTSTSFTMTTMSTSTTAASTTSSSAADPQTTGVVNGGFESGSAAPWTFTGFFSTVSNTRPNSGTFGFKSTAGQGDGVETPTLSQRMFNLMAGTPYELSYFAAGGSSCTVTASVDGQAVTPQAITATYEFYTFIYTPTASTATVSFRFECAGQLVDVFMDDITTFVQ